MKNSFKRIASILGAGALISVSSFLVTSQKSKPVNDVNNNNVRFNANEFEVVNPNDITYQEFQKMMTDDENFIRSNTLRDQIVVTLTNPGLGPNDFDKIRASQAQVNVDTSNVVLKNTMKIHEVVKNPIEVTGAINNYNYDRFRVFLKIEYKNKYMTKSKIIDTKFIEKKTLHVVDISADNAETVTFKNTINAQKGYFGIKDKYLKNIKDFVEIKPSMVEWISTSNQDPSEYIKYLKYISEIKFSKFYNYSQIPQQYNSYYKYDVNGVAEYKTALGIEVFFDSSIIFNADKSKLSVKTFLQPSLTVDPLGETSYNNLSIYYATSANTQQTRDDILLKFTNQAQAFKTYIMQQEHILKKIGNISEYDFIVKGWNNDYTNSEHGIDRRYKIRSEFERSNYAYNIVNPDGTNQLNIPIVPYFFARITKTEIDRINNLEKVHITFSINIKNAFSGLNYYNNNIQDFEFTKIEVFKGFDSSVLPENKKANDFMDLLLNNQVKLGYDQQNVKEVYSIIKEGVSVGDQELRNSFTKFQQLSERSKLADLHLIVNNNRINIVPHKVSIFLHKEKGFNSDKTEVYLTLRIQYLNRKLDLDVTLPYQKEWEENNQTSSAEEQLQKYAAEYIKYLQPTADVLMDYIDRIDLESHGNILPSSYTGKILIYQRESGEKEDNTFVIYNNLNQFFVQTSYFDVTPKLVTNDEKGILTIELYLKIGQTLIQMIEQQAKAKFTEAQKKSMIIKIGEYEFRNFDSLYKQLVRKVNQIDSTTNFNVNKNNIPSNVNSDDVKITFSSTNPLPNDISYTKYIVANDANNEIEINTIYTQGNIRVKKVKTISGFMTKADYEKYVVNNLSNNIILKNNFVKNIPSAISKDDLFVSFNNSDEFKVDYEVTNNLVPNDQTGILSVETTIKYGSASKVVTNQIQFLSETQYGEYLVNSIIDNFNVSVSKRDILPSLVRDNEIIINRLDNQSIDSSVITNKSISKDNDKGQIKVTATISIYGVSKEITKTLSGFRTTKIQNEIDVLTFKDHLVLDVQNKSNLLPSTIINNNQIVFSRDDSEPLPTDISIQTQLLPNDNTGVLTVLVKLTKNDAQYSKIVKIKNFNKNVDADMSILNNVKDKMNIIVPNKQILPKELDLNTINYSQNDGTTIPQTISIISEATYDNELGKVILAITLLKGQSSIKFVKEIKGFKTTSQLVKEELNAIIANLTISVNNLRRIPTLVKPNETIITYGNNTQPTNDILIEKILVPNNQNGTLNVTVKFTKNQTSVEKNKLFNMLSQEQQDALDLENTANAVSVLVENKNILPSLLKENDIKIIYNNFIVPNGIIREIKLLPSDTLGNLSISITFKKNGQTSLKRILIEDLMTKEKTNKILINKVLGKIFYDVANKKVLPSQVNDNDIILSTTDNTQIDQTEFTISKRIVHDDKNGKLIITTSITKDQTNIERDFEVNNFTTEAKHNMNLIDALIQKLKINVANKHVLASEVKDGQLLFIDNDNNPLDLSSFVIKTKKVASDENSRLDIELSISIGQQTQIVTKSIFGFDTLSERSKHNLDLFKKNAIFTINNKESKTPSQVTKQDLLISIPNTNLTVSDFIITPTFKQNDDTGVLDVFINVSQNGQTISIVKRFELNTKTKNDNNAIENAKQYLDITVTNKDVLPSQVTDSNIKISNNSQFFKDNGINISITKVPNDIMGELQIYIILSKGRSQFKKLVTITEFKSKSSAINSDVNKEKDKISANYENKSTLLPSKFDKSQINIIGNEKTTVEIKNIASNDEKGMLSVEVKISDQYKSITKKIEIDGFLTKDQLTISQVRNGIETLAVKIRNKKATNDDLNKLRVKATFIKDTKARQDVENKLNQFDETINKQKYLVSGIRSDIFKLVTKSLDEKASYEPLKEQLNNIESKISQVESVEEQEQLKTEAKKVRDQIEILNQLKTDAKKPTSNILLISLIAGGIATLGLLGIVVFFVLKKKKNKMKGNI